jgi:hypothetical protein
MPKRKISECGEDAEDLFNGMKDDNPKMTWAAFVKANEVRLRKDFYKSEHCNHFFLKKGKCKWCDIQENSL